MEVVFWSRMQFALTAGFHWIFVPLTIGLIMLIAVMETLYVCRGEEHWKRSAKFWMNIFAVNFAVGVATGLILEFEFGTNWSNYSWFVGDIFGAPLAIEGILAFFMESVFIAVMFFGWNRVSKRFHLAATWLTALGATLSALWILVANAWMQLPAGMTFNPDTVRHEMTDFWAVLFSPVAMNKFVHTITSCYVLGSVVVIGISAWFLLKKREAQMAKNSMLLAAVFGLLSSAVLIFTGDGSAQQVARHQPMKLAAMEGLYNGKNGVGLVAFGVLRPGVEPGERQASCSRHKGNAAADAQNSNVFWWKLELPNMLSWLAFRDGNAFVPGINDIINGCHCGLDPQSPAYIKCSFHQEIPNQVRDDSTLHPLPPPDGGGGKTLPLSERISRGKLAIHALADYTQAKQAADSAAMRTARAALDSNFAHFGYGYLSHPNQAVPNVPLTFYSFHIMVILGFAFVALFVVVLFLLYKKTVEKYRWLLYVMLWSIPLAYLASMSGWIVAEVGRQPWVIQDLMPTMAAVSRLEAGAVKLTFFLFAALFTVLLTVELRIMLKQISKYGKKT